MKYRDLIQFEAVTEVIQLVTANKKETATQLVKTYVISDRMADVILHRILPALDLDESSRSRGLLIVGNYGTGKSHLMSVLTSIAEHADLLDGIKNEAVKKQLVLIAGKFMVSRQETTSREIPLGELVLKQLESCLKQMGVDYHFPANTEATTNKQALLDMMAKFSEVHPGKGLIVALDELLDFLLQGNEQEMRRDLNFLREIGEVCEISPLRFMAGIQEALFDNPRFQFIANSIQRVKSRFDEASIVREDIAFVVSHRLLSNTVEQQKIIRKHLEKFTPLYAEMAERLGDFVELFPVHPAYLDAFERVTIGERRELLKAISQEMLTLLDKDLPQDQPGLITYDSYWRMIREDNAFRAIPDVREVLDKSEVLSDKVRRSPEIKEYQAPALRIIDGLALHRITVSDIFTPIGITPTEIRDQLCIHLPLPEQDADFLLATIETILKSILKVVNGQFISHNKENDQYFLDLKKNIDYDALIQAKAESLNNSALDRYYFDLITHALEINTQSAYVPGFRIWESELSWPGHGVTRRGYIFLGAANERSTAHPERDFYIHFMGVYGNGLADRKHQIDEVYFKLAAGEEDLLNLLKPYAGAAEMSAISSGSNKDQYETKALNYRRELFRWLRDNFLRCFKLIHLDEEVTITEAVAKYHVAIREQTFREQAFGLSAAVLAVVFNEKFPKYPSFSGIELTSNTLFSACESAIKAVSGGPNIRLAQVILEGLELAHMDGGHPVWTLEQSPYAAHFIELINGLDAKRVINRKDLVDGEPGAERDVSFQLEPELLAVVLATLLKHGRLSINVQGARIGESDLDNGTRLGLEQLMRFTSISKPPELPEKAVKELFAQFNIDPEIVGKPDLLGIGVIQLQQNLQAELNQVVRMIENLREGPKFWQQMILAPDDQSRMRKELEDYRQFLNGVQNYAAPGRLANLNVGLGEIRAAVKARDVLRDIEHIFDVLDDIRPAWDYLAMAQPLLPEKDPWQAELKQACQYVYQTLSNKDKRSGQEVSGLLKARLENIQSRYVKRYLELHCQYRLDRQQDDVKRQLSADPRWARMRSLSKLSLLPTSRLTQLQDQLGSVETCHQLQSADLQRHTECPYCGFNPASSVTYNKKTAIASLESVKEEFELLCKSWVQTLLENLQTEEAARNLTLIESGERDLVKEFLRTKNLPEKLTERFITGIENTLQGLEVVEIDGMEYLLALTQPGMPCTPDELDKRTREFLLKKLEGKEYRKLRIQINW